MSKLLNILHCKCPKCGKTNLFQFSSFNLFKFIIMYDTCTVCNENFMPEPGFYLGAMYISYFINSFIFLFSALLLMVFIEASLSTTIMSLVVIAVLILPYTLRVSRSLWLSINSK